MKVEGSKANELISERSVEKVKRLQMRSTYAAQCGLTVYKVESVGFLDIFNPF